ncbi:MAG: crossover junction endodeoxyribonuclease RuvC [Candidatus Latescibacterota bacterium]
MVILGIDPSSRGTGYGVVAYDHRRCRCLGSGCVRLREKQSFEDRLVDLHARIGALIAEYRPDQAAIESAFYGKDASAAAKLNQARGVLLLALRQAGLSIAHYTPAQVKNAVTGNGQATKEQVQYMVSHLLGLRELPRPLDASDALAVAVCHTFRPQVRWVGQSGSRRPEVEALLKRMVRR